MEEEYRMQKAQADIQAASANDVGNVVIHEDGTTERRDSQAIDFSTLSSKPKADDDADDDASIRGVVSSESRHGSAMGSSGQADVDTVAANGTDNNDEENIPTIRISTESTRELTSAKETVEKIHTNGNGEADTSILEGTRLQQPVQAAAGENGDQDNNESSGGGEPFSFSNKRLCERWLDNLFMVLYEVDPFFYRMHARELTHT